tara:strand:+ start:11376 stop:13550 length:2175 start_codon:yes stop_codon:yes gene_type:complete
MSVNYFINSIAKSVNAGETWGEQDVDNISGPDQGLVPLTMTINAIDSNYQVDASNFTIKGYQPTSIFMNTDGIEVREWLNGENTIDANGNEISNIQIGGNTNTYAVNKVHMYNSSISGGSVLWPTSGYTESDLNNGNYVYQPFVYDVFAIGSSSYDLGDFANIILGGTTLQIGDVFGAFYEQNGDFVCAGIHQFTYDTLLGGSPLNMQINGEMSQHPFIEGYVGDDDTPFDLPNTNAGFGFTSGQEIHFFILQLSTGNTYRYVNTQWQNDDPANNFQGFVTGNQTVYKPIGTGNTFLYEQTPSTGDANFVNVKAWIDASYQIGLQDIELNLDIDGDATLISPINQSNAFTINVELTNDNPRAKVFSIIPTGTNYYFETPNPLNWQITAVGSDGEATKSSVLCTWNGDEISQANATLLSTNTSAPKQAWFFIVPDDGYTISRHNFYPENSDISSPGTPTVPSNQGGFFNGGPLSRISTLHTYDFEGGNFSEYYNETLKIINATQTPQSGAGLATISGAYAYTSYGSLDLANTIPLLGQFANYEVFFDYGGETVTADFLYANNAPAPFIYADSGAQYTAEFGGNDWAPPQTDTTWSYGQVMFIDINPSGPYTTTGPNTSALAQTQAWGDWDNVPYPYNITDTLISTGVSETQDVPFLFEQVFPNGVLPDDYCAGDWTGNVVLIAFNGIDQHIPGLNPKDITLKLSGQAMLDDGSECASVSGTITEE